jgi:chromosome segregation ATPase
MNKIEELIARKEDAITKTTAKSGETQKTIERKLRIISEHEAKIDKLRSDIEEKQDTLAEQRRYTEGQREVLARLEHELEVFTSIEEKIATAQRIFAEFSDIVSANPKAKRDGTEVEGYSYDRVLAELDSLYRIKTDTENTAQSIYYGKR